MMICSVLCLSLFGITNSVPTGASTIPRLSQKEADSTAFWSKSNKPMVNVNVTKEDLTMLEFFHRLAGINILFMLDQRTTWH